MVSITKAISSYNKKPEVRENISKSFNLKERVGFLKFFKGPSARDINWVKEDQVSICNHQQVLRTLQGEYCEPGQCCYVFSQVTSEFESSSSFHDDHVSENRNKSTRDCKESSNEVIHKQCASKETCKEDYDNCQSTFHLIGCSRSASCNEKVKTNDPSNHSPLLCFIQPKATQIENHHCCHSTDLLGPPNLQQYQGQSLAKTELASSTQLKQEQNNTYIVLNENLKLLSKEHIKQHSLKTHSWRERAERICPSDPTLEEMYEVPTTFRLNVRGKTYKKDRVKVPSGNTMMELIRMEMFKGDIDQLCHISRHEKALHRRCEGKWGIDDPFLFIVNFLLPGSPYISIVSYFALKQNLSIDDKQHPFHDLWNSFVDGNDAYRKTRLKVIPHVRDGPWIAKKAVGSTPLIIGKALDIKYFRGQSNLEVYIDLSSDPVARRVVSLCRMHVSALSVDIAMVLEGQNEAELPEALMNIITFSYLDLSKATPI